MKKPSPVHLCAFISAAVWLAFWPSFLNYESYLYAAGVEGIINIADLYNVFQPDFHMPDFSRYHPNHPLPHAIVFGAWTLLGKLGTSVSALDVFRGLNLVSSVGVVYVTYAIAHRLIADKLTAVAFTLLLSFTSIRWFAAVNGETHMTGYFFLVLSFYLMIRRDNPGVESLPFTLAKAVIFSFAFVFHFGMAIFSLVIALYYIRRFFASADRRHLYSLAIFAAICIFFFFVFYGLLFRLVLNVRTVGEWLRIFSMYSFIPMDGELAQGNGPLTRFFVSLRDGFFPGEGVFANVLAIAFIAFVILGLINLMNDLKRELVSLLLLAWILLPVIFVVVIMKAPNNMSYSSALILPCFLVILLSLKSAFPRPAMQVAVAAWLVAAFTLSMYHVILPKSVPESSAFLAKRIPAQLVPKGEFYALAHTYYGIIPDIYYLGRAHGVKPTKVLFHYDRLIADKLASLLTVHGEFQLLTDQLNERELKWCAENGISITEIFHYEEVQSKKAYWFSTAPRIPLHDTYNRALTLVTLRKARR